MKKFLILLTLNLYIWGANGANAQSSVQSGFKIPVDCVSIFEARKEEISKELEVIDEQRQALEVFRASSATAYEENNKKLAKKEADLNATMKVIEQKRKEIDEDVAKNEKILKELRTMTTDKVNESYAKMKDGAAAEVLSQMPRSNAATILYALDAKKDLNHHG